MSMQFLVKGKLRKLCILRKMCIIPFASIKYKLKLFYKGVQVIHIVVILTQECWLIPWKGAAGSESAYIDSTSSFCILIRF